MYALVAHYRRTVIDSLRRAAHPACRTPGAYRTVAIRAFADLDRENRSHPSANSAADVLRMYHAAVARVTAPVKPAGCGHCGNPSRTCSDCAYLPT